MWVEMDDRYYLTPVYAYYETGVDHPILYLQKVGVNIVYDANDKEMMVFYVYGNARKKVKVHQQEWDIMMGESALTNFWH